MAIHGNDHGHTWQMLKGIIIAPLMANNNGHTGNANGHKWQMIMAIMAIANGNNNGHAWQMLLAIHGSANGHYGHNNGNKSWPYMAIIIAILAIIQGIIMAIHGKGNGHKWQ